jgi:hypothetical protein
MVSDKSLGVWIRSLHFASPFFILLIVSIGNPLLIKLSVAYLLITGLMFLLLKECVLTRYEQRLLKDDVYGVDLALEILGYSKTSKNRYVSTIIIAILFYIIVFSIILL